jgi:arginine decarboxylase
MNDKTTTDIPSHNTPHWGAGYFQINSRGCIEVKKNCDATTRGHEIKEIVEAAHKKGLALPILFRFTDILHDRVLQLYQAFYKAFDDHAYTGDYRLLYPIKVNQQHCVVEEIARTPNNNIGLEAGSKAELMAIMGILDKEDSTIICNGYKDIAYIRLAYLAQKMGSNVFIVIENLSELDIILEQAQKLNIKPQIGVRVRLSTKGAGKWEDSCGVKSKFGLHAKEVLTLITKLKSENYIDCLKLMHCHIGSQIACIQDISQCMQEVSRYYAELRRLDVPISIVDVGGGLGIDYEGTQSSSFCSMNYSLEEYASNIVLAFKKICDETQFPEPNLITESGRAITAHHAVLVTNILECENFAETQEEVTLDSEEPAIIHEIWDAYQWIGETSFSEIYHYAQSALEKANSLFKNGLITLENRAKVEKLYFIICGEIHKNLDKNPINSELSHEIEDKLAAKLFCNFSVFQSLPDAWAINQIFPIMPLSHLQQPHTLRATLHDLSCDSDGKIKYYVGELGIEKSLSLPSYNAEDPFHLAFFLVGAYQEILGGMHNLFGDTNSIEVKLTDEGFELCEVAIGDTLTDVLNYVHYNIDDLKESYIKRFSLTNLPAQEIQEYLNELNRNFHQVTYLDIA